MEILVDQTLMEISQQFSHSESIYQDPSFFFFVLLNFHTTLTRSRTGGLCELKITVSNHSAPD